MADEFPDPETHDAPGDPAPAEQSGPPATVLAAGVVVTFEGAVGIICAIIILGRAIAGHSETGISGYGTAAWFAAIFGAVLVAGIALLRGRRGGRGVGIITQILLAPVVFSLLGQSHQVVWGILLLLIIIPGFVLLVHPRTSAWMNRSYDSDE